jgi:hypothetical protein
MEPMVTESEAARGELKRLDWLLINAAWGSLAVILGSIYIASKEDPSFTALKVSVATAGATAIVALATLIGSPFTVGEVPRLRALRRRRLLTAAAGVGMLVALGTFAVAAF